MAEQIHDVQAASGQLLAFIERIERTEEDLRAVQEDRKEIYAEAKGGGWDVAVMKKIVRLRAQDRDKRREEAEILELYATAIGMEV